MGKACKNVTIVYLRSVSPQDQQKWSRGQHNCPAKHFIYSILVFLCNSTKIWNNKRISIRIAAFVQCWYFTYRTIKVLIDVRESLIICCCGEKPAMFNKKLKITTARWVQISIGLQNVSRLTCNGKHVDVESLAYILLFKCKHISDELVPGLKHSVRPEVFRPAFTVQL